MRRAVCVCNLGQRFMPNPPCTKKSLETQVNPDLTEAS